MPYDVITDLPDKIRAKIPSKQGKEIFMNAFNRAYEATGGIESSAFASAWGALKGAGYYPDDDGEYRQIMRTEQQADKTSPGLSSVHVNSTDNRVSIRKVEVGDMVEWNSSGGKASGKVVSIHTSGTVPDIPVKITASEDEPAVRIQIYRDGEPTDTFVGHKVDTVVQKQESYKLPDSARNNARRVLEWKEKYGDEVNGMTEVGWRRARQLANNETVGLETVQAMAQFARHEENKDVAAEYEGEPWKDAGHVAWLGWGGDTGIDWAREISDNVEKKESFTFSNNFTKMNEDKRLVYGWASVVEKNGIPVKDLQGDFITPEELAKAAHEYMIQSRTAKVMHEGSKKGELVESMVFTEDIQDALGIDLGLTGWFVGFKIYDDETWKRVKSGELKMFSIGGRGKREQLN